MAEDAHYAQGFSLSDPDQDYSLLLAAAYAKVEGYERIKRLMPYVEAVLTDIYIDRLATFGQNKSDQAVELFLRTKRPPYERVGDKVEAVVEGLEPDVFIRDDGRVYWKPDPGKGSDLLDASSEDHEFLSPIALSRATVERFINNPEEFERAAEALGLEELQTAPGFRIQLKFSVPEIKASRQVLPAVVPPCDGNGVVVGVVDYGCDFVHPNFRTGACCSEESNTRILWLWDQNAGRPAPDVGNEIAAGRRREFDHRALNDALRAREGDPYRALGYDPDDRPVSYVDPSHPATSSGGPMEEAGAHGTHVMDIAAGNGAASGTPGVAPGADLIFVEARSKPFATAAPISPVFLAAGVAYIFHRADQLGLPAVVNLSINGNGGPHDGTTAIDQAFELMLKKSGRAIVVSAGNYREAGLHASDSVTDHAPRTITWRFFEGDKSPNQLEIWYEPSVEGASLQVTLIAPDGSLLGPVHTGEVREIKCNGRRIGLIVGSRHHPWHPLPQIVVRLEPRQKEEDWRVRLHFGDQEHPHCRAQFHAWIERDDAGQSRFIETDAVRSCTLGSLACGDSVIVAGAYSAILDGREPSFFSSEGPTRDNRPKPDVNAPGQMIHAARSKGFQLRSPEAAWRTAASVAKSGTSMAAPHVAGAVALLLQKNPKLDARAIADILRSTASPPDSQARAWDPRAGYGRIDAAAALARAPGPAQASLPQGQAMTPRGQGTARPAQGGRR
jgi:subtilisin family serine protease